MRENTGFPKEKWLWIALFLAMTVAVVTAGHLYYRGEMRSAKQQQYQELHAVAQLKSGQIQEWREERVQGLQVVANSPFFSDAVEYFIRGRGTTEDSAPLLLQRLKVVRNDYRYQDALIVDLEGKILLSATEETRTLDPAARGTVEAALHKNRAILGDFYLCSVCGQVHIDAAGPILDKHNRPVAVLVFRLDPKTDLYPLMQSWPTPSKSAETYLVRKEGAHAVFLNDLRHHPNSALKLKEPLSKNDSPAVRAVLGTQGLFEGRDYRGIDVIADIVSVPQSPWFLVAKADSEELLATVHQEAREISILVLMLVILAGVGTGLVFVSRQKSLYADLYRAEKERSEAREELRSALYSIGDGVITTDTNGHVRYMNPVAEKLTGWIEAEAQGRPLPEVFHIVNESTRDRVESPALKGLREDSTVWLANCTVLVAKDGSECPIADSAAPVRDEKGLSLGSVLVFRDERRERVLRGLVETRLALIEYAANHTLDELLTRSLDEACMFVDSPIGFYHFVEPDQETLSLQQWSTRTLKEFCRAEGKGTHYGIDQAGVWVDCVHQKKPVIHNDYASLPHKKGMPEGHAELIRELVVPVMREDKIVAILGVGNKPSDYSQRDVEIVSYLADVTWEIIRKKQAEIRLSESETKYRELVQDANSAIIRWKKDGTISYFNEYAQSVFGYRLEEALGKSIGILVPERESTGRDLSMLVQDIVDRPQRYVNNVNENVCRDGRRIWMAWTNKAMLDQEGGVTEILAVGSDISAQKEAESSLRVSDERYQVLFQHAPVMYIITRNEQGVPFITDCNELFLRTLGYSREDVVEKPLADFYTPESKAALLEGGGYAGALEGQYFIGERHLVTRDRGQVPTLLYTERELDTSGEVIGTRAAFVDITNLRSAEEALRLKNGAVEWSISGISIAGLDGNLIYVNKAALHLWGYAHEQEVVGERAVEFWMSEKEVQGAVEAAMKSGSWIGELIAKRKDGFPVDVQAAITLVKGTHGEPVAIMGSFLDISERKRSQEAILRAKNEWERTFDAVPDLISILDKNNRILRVNRAMAEALAVSPGEAIGKICYQVVHGTESPPDFCPHVKMLKDGKQHSVEMYEESFGGHFHVTVSPLSDPEGHLMGCVQVARNVSAQKAMEERLRESEEKFSCAFQFAPMPMAITSFDDGRVVEVNEAFLKSSGYERDEALGKTDVEIGTWKDDAERTFRLEQIRETGTLLNLEMAFSTKHGTLRNGLFSAVIIHLQGRPMLLSAFNDITERNRAEEARLESEQRYKALFEDSRDPVFVTTRDGKFIDTNRAFSDLLGYDSQELETMMVQQTYADLTQRQIFQEAVEKTGSTMDLALQVRKKDGTILDTLLTASVRYGKHGEILGYQGIIRDVTEKKQLEKQLLQAQKMEAVGTLAGGVAHDFNNILQVVLGYSELLLSEEQLPKKFREDLTKMNVAARNGAGLVKQLLTFSRKAEVKPLHLNLNGRIEQLQKMLSRTISKMIEMELYLSDDLWSINADPTQVDQVLMNLAVNARDAMPEGGKLLIETKNVTLDEDYARSHLGAKPGSYVLLSVSDTGHGMDRETLQHIFEPFFTTKGLGEGTGLGLATVYGIMKHHEGHITCYSEPGLGTTFRLYFPAVISDEQAIETAPRTLPRGGSETLFLVDDEEFIRDLGSRILTKAGYKVVTASNGKEALEMYRSRADEIALIILDLIMPEMDGKQCLEELLQINPAIKIVIASGYSANGPTKEALSAGAKGFVNKPYDIRQVLEVVRSVLDQE